MKSTDPRRGLTRRQLEFVALGGSIGAGLFLGAGQGVHLAGPGMALAYLVAGLMVFIVARCLAEMALADASPGTFVRYTERYVGPRAAFVQAWGYTATCVIICMAELTAAAQFIRVWTPGLPLWSLELAGLVLLVAVNRLNVRVFGEVEFWISLLKILAIEAFLLLGVVLLTGVAHDRAPDASISNLWSRGGFLPTGAHGLVAALPLALFAFGGTELIGIAAAEAEDPRRAIPRATNGLLFRIGLFYVAVTLVLVCLEPWSRTPVNSSPIVQVLNQVGVPGAAAMMNVVLISAVLSSGNAAVFAAVRMVKVLGEMGGAPRSLSELNANQAPGKAAILVLAAVSTAIGLSLVTPNGLFQLLLAMATMIMVANWALFLVAHLRFRDRRGEGDAAVFAVPGAPWTNYLVLALIVFAAVVACADPGLRLGAGLAVGLLAILAAAAALRMPGRTASQGSRPRPLP